MRIRYWWPGRAQDPRAPRPCHRGATARACPGAVRARLRRLMPARRWRVSASPTGCGSGHALPTGRETPLGQRPPASRKSHGSRSSGLGPANQPHNAPTHTLPRADVPQGHALRSPILGGARRPVSGR
jgi:hypothetical protein